MKAKIIKVQRKRMVNMVELIKLLVAGEGDTLTKTLSNRFEQTDYFFQIAIKHAAKCIDYYRDRNKLTFESKIAEEDKVEEFDSLKQMKRKLYGFRFQTINRLEDYIQFKTIKDGERTYDFIGVQFNSSTQTHEFLFLENSDEVCETTNEIIDRLIYTLKSEKKSA